MNSLVIGVAGGTGSGKTSVTQKIVQHLDISEVVVIAQDSYYRDISAFGGLTPEEVNFDHPDSLETNLLVRQLQDLKSGKSIDQPIYDFTTHRRLEETKRVSPTSIIIVEGILLFVERELRDLMEIKIFIDADADERLVRRIRRDILERGRLVDSVMNQYMSTVKPMHLQFVEPSKHWADIIIPRGADNTVAIDMLVTKIRSMLLLKGKSKK